MPKHAGISFCIVLFCIALFVYIVSICDGRVTVSSSSIKLNTKLTAIYLELNIGLNNRF